MQNTKNDFTNTKFNVSGNGDSGSKHVPQSAYKVPVFLLSECRDRNLPQNRTSMENGNSLFLQNLNNFPLLLFYSQYSPKETFMEFYSIEK